MSYNFLKGFASLRDQDIVTQPMTINATSGNLPTWLKGSLIHTGPARFEVEAYDLRHWFDGMSALYKFRFPGDGTLQFSDSLLESQAWINAKQYGRLFRREFATTPDLGPILLDKFKHGDLQGFLDLVRFSDNANVNIGVINNHFVAYNDAPIQTEFDPKTLQGRGSFQFTQDSTFDLAFGSSPHPHYDPATGQVFNYCTVPHIFPLNLPPISFNPPNNIQINLPINFSYELYRVDPNSQKRTVFASWQNRSTVSYMHSFALTKQYMILTEYPLRIDNTHLLRFYDPGNVLTNLLDWNGNAKTFFQVFQRNGQNNQQPQTWEADTFFSYHHINAFEQGNDIFIDLIAYDSTASFENFMFSNLMQPNGGQATVVGEFRRYQLPAGQAQAKLVLRGDAHNIPHFEVPRINYEANNTRPYHYIYGAGHDATFYDCLLKIELGKDAAGNDTISSIGKWPTNSSPNTEYYVGEPFFVANPNPTAEDDGVVFDIVLDAINDHSFLLVLDAQTFTEKARFNLPSIIPYGLHSQFYPGQL